MSDPIPEPTVPAEQQVGRAERPEEPARPVDPPTAPPLSLRECPNCGATSTGEALFCEACGFDLVTGAAPLRPPGEELPPTSEQALQPHQAYSLTRHRDASEEALDLLSERAVQHSGPTPPGAVPEPSQPVTAVPPPVPPGEAARRPAHEPLAEPPPSRRDVRDWVVEVWVDRGWHERQASDQPCPPQGAPRVVPVRSGTLILGRASGSLGVRPEVDAGDDAGVSRQHAQLTTDGHRFWVRDLSGPNGTFVGTVGEPLPREPIGPDEQVEVGTDDRIWLGAWTRVVVRPAAESERPPAPDPSG